MNEINTDHLLGQIRKLQAELQSPVARPEKSPEAPPFASLLKQSLDKVNEAQQTSGAMKESFVTGSSEHTLVDVMVASQKADLSFRAMAEVRNKLITAYQEIMNMPV